MSTPEKKDQWVCRIPRSDLHAVAADKRLFARERVWAALWAAMYSDIDHPGEGPASISSLVAVTGLPRRSVQRILDDILATGSVGSSKGPSGSRKARRFFLSTGGAVRTNSTGGAVQGVPGERYGSVPGERYTLMNEELSLKKRKASPLRPGKGAGVSIDESGRMVTFTADGTAIYADNFEPAHKPARVTVTCRKISYASRREARDVLRQWRGPKPDAYWCAIHGAWHIGSNVPWGGRKLRTLTREKKRRKQHA